MSNYLWMDCQDPFASHILYKKLDTLLQSFLGHTPDASRPVLFLCIGTPEIPGDSLGPMVGTYIKKYMSYPVYGTYEHPIHALNLKRILRHIKKHYTNPIIIVIDAAIGNYLQEGFITLKRGALRPGSGLGKKLPAIGHIQITGVFQSLYGDNAAALVNSYAQCIVNSLVEFN